MTERFSSAALGFVCIVGAGTGRLDLMTLRTLNRLGNADVVAHDRLVSTEVFDQLPPQAQSGCVGKTLRNHAVSKQGIHTLQVAHAQLDIRVVRLKGGDPYVLGRGGEEVRALQADAICTKRRRLHTVTVCLGRVPSRKTAVGVPDANP